MKKPCSWTGRLSKVVNREVQDHNASRLGFFLGLSLWLPVVSHCLAVSSQDVFCARASLVSLCMPQFPLFIRKPGSLD